MSDNNEVNQPLVSIIVITYNSLKYVIETLDSAKAQTYQNIELIVSDDCSTDITVEICREWIEKNKERFVRTELIAVDRNSGIPANCNRGIKAAKGRWVKLIAGDDVLYFDAIEKCVSFVNTNKDVSFLFGKVSIYRNNFEECNLLTCRGSVTDNVNKVLTPELQYEIMLRENVVWSATWFVKRELFESMGYYDERYILFEDRPFLLKITKCKVRIFFVDIFVAKYRRSEQSVQLKKRKELYSVFTISKDLFCLDNSLKDYTLKERLLIKLMIDFRVFLAKISNNKYNVLLGIINYLIMYLPTRILGLIFKRQIKNIVDKCRNT